CDGSATATASEALDQMRDFSAVWYWGGHAGPGRVVFCDAGLNKTRVVSAASVGAAFAPAGFATVSNLAAGALDHVFLVVLRGCQTANAEKGFPSLPAALVRKGVDLVVAFKKKVPSDSA